MNVPTTLIQRTVKRVHGLSMQVDSTIDKIVYLIYESTHLGRYYVRNWSPRNRRLLISYSWIFKVCELVNLLKPCTMGLKQALSKRIHFLAWSKGQPLTKVLCQYFYRIWLSYSNLIFSITPVIGQVRFLQNLIWINVLRSVPKYVNFS